MEYIALIESTPFVMFWMAPILGLGFVIFAVLILSAWLHDRRSSPEQ